MLALRCKFVDIGAENNLVLSNWRNQIDRDRAKISVHNGPMESTPSVQLGRRVVGGVVPAAHGWEVGANEVNWIPIKSHLDTHKDTVTDQK